MDQSYPRSWLVGWQQLLVGIARIPDPGFGHEIESDMVNHRCRYSLAVRSEEYGRAEDPLNRIHQAPIGRALDLVANYGQCNSFHIRMQI